jgi:hypothetical protein
MFTHAGGAFPTSTSGRCDPTVGLWREIPVHDDIRLARSDQDGFVQVGTQACEDVDDLCDVTEGGRDTDPETSCRRTPSRVWVRTGDLVGTALEGHQARDVS